MYKDDHTKMIFGHVCERKGESDTRVIEKIKEDIARLGYQDVILKGDGEPALVQVLEHVKFAREAPSIIQHSPACDPQANGAAENAVQDYMRQVRTIKIGLKARLKCKVESDWKIMEWTTELGGELLSRGQVSPLLVHMRSCVLFLREGCGSVFLVQGIVTCNSWCFDWRWHQVFVARVTPIQG